MIMILLGAPGAGKGTLSAALKEKGNIVHISTGDCFRALMNVNTPFAKVVKGIMEKGELISDELTNKVVKEELSKYDLEKTNIILDGYPRNVSQLEYLNSIVHIDYAIDVDVPQDILIKRLTGRYSCPQCKAIYNIYYKKPIREGVCDKDGAALVQRKDDNPDVVQARFEQYQKLNAPLVAACKKMGIYHMVDNQDLHQAISKVQEICKL